MEEQKFQLLDVKGTDTGVAFNKKMVIALVVAIAVMIVISMIPMNAYGEKCSLGLGFFVGMILFISLSPSDPAIAGMLVVTVATLLGLVTWGEVGTALGTSAFYPTLGMAIVALGAEFTPFGRRFAYWFLYKFGQKPVRMVLAFGFAASLISAFVSNVAVIILMSAICNTTLLAMGEKPGQSKFGKAFMLIILMCAEFGGIALINGAPGGNNLCLGLMTAASGDLNLAVSYRDWAFRAFPTWLITIIPAIFIYIKYFGIKNNDENLKILPKSYYKEKLDEIGKLQGAEFRWIVITLIMIVCMLTGMNANLAAMLFAAISMFPLVGCSSFKNVMKRLPWGVIVALGTYPIFGTILSGTGVTAWIQAVVTPVLGNMGPLMLSIVLSVIMFVLVNVCINGFSGILPFVITVGTTVSIGLGYNPCVVVFPAMLSASMMWVFGSNVFVMLNKDYGWWEINDPILPGAISGLFLSIVCPILSYLFSSLLGMSVLL